MYISARTTPMGSARRYRSRPINHRAVYRAARRMSVIVVGCILHVPCTSAVGLSPSGAVNTTPPAVAVYIALADGRRVVAKFSKSTVWDRSALIFGDTLNSLKHGVAYRSRETCTQKSVRSVQPIDTCRPVDGTSMNEECEAVKTTL